VNPARPTALEWLTLPLGLALVLRDAW
jgi:hypothetical protein